jgi:hypothetical protein
MLSKKNPFNPAEQYGTGALILGTPAAEGRVGYTPNGTNPYYIEAGGKGTPNRTLILTLQETS